MRRERAAPGLSRAHVALRALTRQRGHARAETPWPGRELAEAGGHAHTWGGVGATALGREGPGPGRQGHAW
jgi:hypothetical protein